MAREIVHIPARQELRNRAASVGQHIRVAAYCRVSTEQDEQLNSFENQVNYYTEYITRNPQYEMAGIYAEMKIANLIQFESLNTQEIGRNKGLLTYSTMSEAFIFLQSSMRKKIRGFKC